MSELKPCPFCGGNAELGGDDAHEYAVVYCEKCGNSTDGYLVDECGYHHASEAWNRRTPEEALTEINRLQSEECKQLQQDNAELLKALEVSTRAWDQYFKNGEMFDYEEYESHEDILEKHKCN